VILQLRPFGPASGARIGGVRLARGIDANTDHDEPARRVVHRATIQGDAPGGHA
jgi:hypothetical protein